MVHFTVMYNEIIWLVGLKLELCRLPLARVLPSPAVLCTGNRHRGGDRAANHLLQ